MRTFRTGLLVICVAGLVSGCTLLHRVETAAHLGQTPAKPAAAAPATTPPVQLAQGDMVAPPDWMVNDIACAPSLTTEPEALIKVIGSQDTIIKHMLGPGDTLLISAVTQGHQGAVTWSRIVFPALCASWKASALYG